MELVALKDYIENTAYMLRKILDAEKCFEECVKCPEFEQCEIGSIGFLETIVRSAEINLAEKDVQEIVGRMKKIEL